MAAGEALVGRKLLDLKAFKVEAQAAIEKKSSRLGLSLAILSFVLLATAGAYGLILGACYLWLVESMAPQAALLTTAVASITLAFMAALVWKYRSS